MLRKLIQSILLFIFLGSLLGCKVQQSTTGGSTDETGAVSSTELEKSYPAELLPLIYHPQPSRENDLIHTMLEVKFDWKNQQLIGKARLELKPYFYPKNQLLLDAKGFEISGIHLIRNDVRKKLDYEYDGLMIYIELDREYNRNEHYLVEIDYIAKPYEFVEDDPYNQNPYKGLYFINPTGGDSLKPRQIWTQGETEYNSIWFPTIDQPNERTTQEMFITTDTAFTTLSNGVLVYSQNNGDGTKTDYWKMDQPHSPHLFMMAIGEFAIVKDHWSSTNKQIEVNYYLEPSHEDYAKQIFGNTPKMLSFFSNRLGYEFPWPKYSQVIVRDFVTGAMENTTASVFMESLQMDHRELEDMNWDYIIAHELMHQWFGDLVTCESWSNLPLNEAFANYGEYLWLEHEYGLEEAEHHGFQELEKYLEEAETKQVDLIRFDYDDNEDMFDEHSYAKGGRILHMLRKYVGDEAFFQSLKYYLNTHEFSSVEVHDLRLAFEHITGEDLNWFFDQWFFASGHPQLQVTHSYDSGQLLVTVAQLQDLETTPLYRLPLYLDVWIGENYYRYPLEIIHQYEEFEIDLGQAPDLVLFDGDQQLLAEIDHEKSWQELINQYYYSDQFLARYESIFLISDLPQDSLFRRVLWDAMQDPSWVIREASISAFQNYEGTEIEEITRRIREAYMSDPKSVVRSAAVDVLSSIDVNSFKEIYRTGMKDLSYAVVGSSLDAYLKTGEKDKLEVISKFLDYKSIDILIPIADYFSTNQMTDQIPWIEEKMKYLNGLDLWYMLQYFGALSMEAPDKYQQLSISTFEKYAITHPQSFIRLAAVQGLSLLSDTPGVDTLIKEIKGQERDPELRVIYEQF